MFGKLAKVVYVLPKITRLRQFLLQPDRDKIDEAEAIADELMLRLKPDEYGYFQALISKIRVLTVRMRDSGSPEEYAQEAMDLITKHLNQYPEGSMVHKMLAKQRHALEIDCTFAHLIEWLLKAERGIIDDPQQALNWCQYLLENSKQYRPDLIRAYLTAIAVHSILARNSREPRIQYDTMLRLCDEAMPLLDGNPEEIPYVLRYKSVALMGLADCGINATRNNQLARDVLANASRLIEQQSDPSQDSYYPMVLMNEATVLRRLAQNNPDRIMEAMDKLGQAQRLLEGTPHYLEALNNVAVLHLEMAPIAPDPAAEFRAALDACFRARDLMDPRSIYRWDSLVNMQGALCALAEQEKTWKTESTVADELYQVLEMENEALEYAYEAIEIHCKAVIHGATARRLLTRYLSNSEAQQMQQESARRLSRAANLARKRGYYELAVQSLLRLGVLWSQKATEDKELRSAWKAYTKFLRALQIADEVRSLINVEGHRRAYQNQIAQLHREIVKICLILGNHTMQSGLNDRQPKFGGTWPEEAWYWAVHGKACFHSHKPKFGDTWQEEAWYWAEHGKIRSLLDQISTPRVVMSREQQGAYDRWKQSQRLLFDNRASEELRPPRDLRNDSPMYLAVGKVSSTREELKASERELRLQFIALMESSEASSNLLQTEVPRPYELRRTWQELVSGATASAPRPLLVEFYLLDDEETSVFLAPLWDASLPLETFTIKMRQGTWNQIFTDYTNGLADVIRKPQTRRGALLTEVREALNDNIPDNIVPDPNGLWNALHGLGANLFEGQRWFERLVSLDPTVLVVAPNLQMHQMPIQAAIWDGETLIERYPITMVPAASIADRLLQSRRAIQNREDRLSALLLGPPDVEDEIPAVGSQSDRLIDAKAEIKRVEGHIRKLYGSAPLVRQGVEMRIAELRAAAVQHPRIIHLATHSSCDPDSFLDSAICFHGETLSVREIRDDPGLHIPGVEMWYLGSCESGVPELDHTDELTGFVRELFYTGARSVMATMWPVHDEAAKQFAFIFYRYLAQDGLSRAEAYQKACCEMRRNKEEDYRTEMENEDQRQPHQQSNEASNAVASVVWLWAPFVLFGDSF